ncbi:MAG: M48 family metalloprotease, partial [Verrucomicrobia bacterium]|nr:M48 family metalloprotease [Verrucomicrobiota bacterium]
MNKTIRLFAFISVVAVLSGCSTVPIIGRKQPPMPPAEYMAQQSALSYRQVLADSALSTDSRQTAQLQRVGKRISEAVELFMTQNGMADRVGDFYWEFNLIESDVPNAWCMPGGKVAFFTGILPYTKDETGMAVVMGHEVAHAVARHGSERLTYQVAQQGFGALLSWGTKDSDYQEAYMQLYGLGTQYGAILPFSRLHENEADRLGLIFMAMAG